jgi:hypothetical protein
MPCLQLERQAVPQSAQQRLVCRASRHRLLADAGCDVVQRWILHFSRRGNGSRSLPVPHALRLCSNRYLSRVRDFFLSGHVCEACHLTLVTVHMGADESMRLRVTVRRVFVKSWQCMLDDLMMSSCLSGAATLTNTTAVAHQGQQP